jgi:hypothetical protein
MWLNGFGIIQNFINERLQKKTFQNEYELYIRMPRKKWMKILMYINQKFEIYKKDWKIEMRNWLKYGKRLENFVFKI